MAKRVISNTNDQEKHGSGSKRQSLDSAQEQQAAYEEDLAAILAAAEDDIEESDSDDDDGDNLRIVHVIPEDNAMEIPSSNGPDPASSSRQRFSWLSHRHHHPRLGGAYQVGELPSPALDNQSYQRSREQGSLNDSSQDAQKMTKHGT